MKIAAGRDLYQQYAEKIQAVMADVDWALMEHGQGWSQSPENAEIAVLVGETYGDAFKAAILESPVLRWVHTENTGTDQAFYQELLAREITLTNSPGANAPEVAEFVMAMLLGAVKKLAVFRTHQQRREWVRHDLDCLSRKTMLILGMGAIGGRVATLGRVFGLHVLGINRSGSQHPETDETGTLADLREFLPRADIIVVALPLTPETQHRLGAPEFATMKPNTILINVGRGGVLDHQALLATLARQPEFQACLDVFPVEPLPQDSPLWQVPNLLVTPHIAWSSPLYRQRAGAIWFENFRRLVAGEPLRNVVKRPSRGRTARR